MSVRPFLLTLLFMMLIGWSAMAQDASKPGEGVTVEPGIDTAVWSQPVEAIFRLLLEELGYQVRPAVSLSNPIFYQVVAEGDLDYWANGWFPLQLAQLPDNFEERATIIGTIVEAGAIQGYLVDKASAEEYGITSLEDRGSGDGSAQVGLRRERHQRGRKQRVPRGESSCRAALRAHRDSVG
jgi:glycine betaine/proline transport system substrate-binding protein